MSRLRRSEPCIGAIASWSLAERGCLRRSTDSITHAIWPANANDNVAARQLQGHSGTLSDCSVCHTTLPLTLQGPHGMHNVGDPRWSDEEGHGKAYERHEPSCRACHGQDLLGSPLGRMSKTRTIGRVTLAAGEPVRCNRCHERGEQSGRRNQHQSLARPKKPRRPF